MPSACPPCARRAKPPAWVVRGLLALVFALAASASLPVVAAETFARSAVVIETAAGASHPFAVEMAITPAERSRGLQFRRHLDDDAGMLFDFGRTAPVTMWMKNTPLSLDMLFLTADGRVAHQVEGTTAQSTAIIPSGGPVRAVLEVRAGTLARLGIRPGDHVRHPLFGD